MTRDEFLAHVRAIGEKVGPDACWEWDRCRDLSGYGQVRYEGSNRGTHRLAYALLVRPFERGELACHHCDNPPCCNPTHIFPGTKRDNAVDAYEKGILDGNLKAMHDAWRGTRRTHCKRGHELTPENVQEANGRRNCKQCSYARVRAFKKKQRENHVAAV